MAEDSYLRRLFNFIFGWGKTKASPTPAESHGHFEALTHYHFHDRPTRITTEVVWHREAASEAIPTVVEQEIHPIPTRPIDNTVEIGEQQYEGEVQEAVPETCDYNMDGNGEGSTSDAATEEYEASTAIRVESTTPRMVRFSNIPPRLEETEDSELEALMVGGWITHEPIDRFQPFNHTTAAHSCSSECVSFAAFGLPTEFICTRAYYPQEVSYNVWPSQVVENSVRPLSAAPEFQSSVPPARSEAHSKTPRAPIWQKQPEAAYPLEELYFVAPSPTLDIGHEVEVEDVIDELPTVVDDSRCRCAHSQSEYQELSATLERLPAMITGALRDFHSSAKRESCHPQPQSIPGSSTPKPLPSVPDEDRAPTLQLLPLPQASTQYPLHTIIGHGGWTSPHGIPDQFPLHYLAHHIPLCYAPLHLLSGTAGHCRAHQTSPHADPNTGLVGHAAPGSQDPADGARMNTTTQSDELNHRSRNDKVQLREILVHSSLPDGHADYTQARAVYRRTRVQRLKRSLRLANGEDLRKIALSITPTLAALRG